MLASWLAFEDGPAETLSTIFLFAASFCMLWHAFELVKSGHKSLAALSLLIALAFFVFGGEEISWGQRILGHETGEFLQEHNWQGETNFHNLHTDLSNMLYHWGALVFLIILPVFKKQFTKLFSKLRIGVVSYFIPAAWIAVPSFVIIGMLDPRYLTQIEKPAVAAVFLSALAVGALTLLYQLIKAYKSEDYKQLKLLNLSLVLIVCGLIASALLPTSGVGYSPNTLAEFKELIIALGLFSFALQLAVQPEIDTKAISK